jgi:hypothetical protein
MEADMAKEPKTRWVAFKGASMVPGKVLGVSDNRRMQPGEAVELPTAYADHVVSDGFAEAVDAPKAKPAAKAKAKAATTDLAGETIG